MSSINIGGMRLEVLSSVRVAAVEITPEQCATIRSHMTEAQRNISQAKVNEYAKQMLAGQFPLTNDALVFSTASNTWLNGQHRTEGAAMSGRPLKVLVLEVDDDSVMKVIDGGKPRSLADAIVSLGYQYGRELSGVGSVWLSYKRGLLTPSSNMGLSSQSSHIGPERTVTRQERIAFCQKHSKTILNALTFCVPLVNQEGVATKNLAATAYCIIAEKDGDEAARGFVRGLITGNNCSGAASACRRALVRAMKIRGKGLGYTVRLGMILKAYVYERSGHVPATMCLKSNEAFPVV